MNVRSLLFRATAIMVFVQIALGGLVTFSFITPEVHIFTGLVVLILAVAAMVMALAAKPPFQPIRGLSVALVVLLMVQIILGFVAMRGGSDIIAWVHLVVAMAIYGMAVSGTLMATRWDQVRSDQAVARQDSEAKEGKRVWKKRMSQKRQNQGLPKS